MIIIDYSISYSLSFCNYCYHVNYNEFPAWQLTFFDICHSCVYSLKKVFLKLFNHVSFSKILNQTHIWLDLYSKRARELPWNFQGNETFRGPSFYHLETEHSLFFNSNYNKMYSIIFMSINSTYPYTLSFQLEK